MYFDYVKNLFLVLVLHLLIGCSVDDKSSQISTLTRHFNSYVEKSEPEREIKYILICDLGDDIVKFTSLIKYRVLISRDTVSLIGSNKYVINNYNYFDDGPWEDKISMKEYEDLVIQIHNKYLNSEETIIEYKNVLCEKRMFNEMYRNLVNSQR